MMLVCDHVNLSESVARCGFRITNRDDIRQLEPKSAVDPF